MKQNKLFINNPVTLHFYSQEELLPDDNSAKIVITEDAYFEFAYYNKDNGKWYLEWTDERIVFDVIAWATFSPEWVVSETDRDIFGCK